MSHSPPTLDQIRATQLMIEPFIRQTPVWLWESDLSKREFSGVSKVWIKLELLQRAGSFKARGAIANLLNLTEAERRLGVTAVSAGNHAAAVAYAAHIQGVAAKVVMPKSANPQRVALCQSFGAEVVFAEDFLTAFELVEHVRTVEGKSLIHPFEGEITVRGTATLGLEFLAQVPVIEALVVPIGGGGLISGVAAVAKLINPRILVYGVEPFGAPTLYASRRAGSPQALSSVSTIADSLGAPKAMPYTFSIIERLVDDIVLVSDDELCIALDLIFSDLKLAVEPAAAAATAALAGPLRDRLAGKKVGIIACGSNTDEELYCTWLRRGAALRRVKSPPTIVGS